MTSFRVDAIVAGGLRTFTALKSVESKLDDQSIPAS
jgi:hypothetical protein